MVVNNLRSVCQGCSSGGRSNAIEIGPKGFQNFPRNNTGTRYEGRGITEKAFILVTMNVKEADRPIDLQATRQQMADSVLQVTKVLAHNIIDQHCTLLLNDTCRSQTRPISISSSNATFARAGVTRGKN